MYRVIVATLLILCLSTSTGYAYKNEPTGFRSFQWGTNINEVKDQMKFKAHIPEGGGMDLYSLKDESLEFGAAKANDVTYIFWNGKLWSVTVMYDGRDNFKSFDSILTNSYGYAKQPNQFINEYFWLGKKTVIIFDYSRVLDNGCVMFRSVEIEDEIKAWRDNKNRNAKF